jgi:hypothetical protein
VGNTPTIREQREAHDRRAQIIDELHAQANATCNYVLAQQRVIGTRLRGAVPRRRSRFMLIGVAFIALALACAFALAGMLIMAS